MDERQGTLREAIASGWAADDYLPAVGEVWNAGGGGYSSLPVCTATLISPRHVLTAAHCFVGTAGPASLVAFHMRRRTEEGVLEEHVLRLSNCAVEGGDAVVDPADPRGLQPGYWPGCAVSRPDEQCDVAVCVLDQPVNAYPGLEGFCDWLPLLPPRSADGLATSLDAMRLLAGRQVLQIGRGEHSAGAPNPEAWKRADFNIIDDASIAASGTYAGLGKVRTACGHGMHGDSGGPLLVFEGGRALIVGVLSSPGDTYGMVLARSAYRWIHGLLEQDYAGAPWLEDTDEDGIVDSSDNCPASPNDGQADLDGDGYGDECDNCMEEANDQSDSDLHLGPLPECPSLPATEITKLRDGRGDACDSCPTLADHADENSNRTSEDLFGPDVIGPEHGLRPLGDACDPDPVVPRVDIVPRIVRSWPSDPTLPVFCGLVEDQTLRFWTYGFRQAITLVDPPLPRKEPVRLLWCSCWDSVGGIWLTGGRCSSRALLGPCLEDGFDARSAADIADRRGWFDLARYRWNSVWEFDEDAPTDDFRDWRWCYPASRDTEDWDGDTIAAELLDWECVPLGWGHYDSTDGVEFRANGRIPDVGPRIHEVRWSWMMEKRPPTAPTPYEEPNHLARLWLRPEPDRVPGGLRSGGWSDRVRLALPDGSATGNQFNNFYGQRWFGRYHCWSPWLTVLVRETLGPTVSVPPPPIGGGLPDGAKSEIEDATALLLAPLDESTAPLPTDAAFFRFPDPGPAPAVSGLAVAKFDGESQLITQVLASRAAAGSSPPSTKGFASAAVTRRLQQDATFAALAESSAGGFLPDPAMALPASADNARPAVLFVFGGRDGNGDYPATLWAGIEIPGADPFVEWREIPANDEVEPPGREGAALFATSDGLRLVLVGGRNEQGTLADAWAFDLRTGLWRPFHTVGLALRPRAYAAAAQIGDRAWLYGGLAADEQNPRPEQLFWIDLRTGAAGGVVSSSWPTLAPRTASALAATPAGRLVLYGGMDEKGWHSDLVEFDPGAARWSPLTDDCVAAPCPPAGPGVSLLIAPVSQEPVVFAGHLSPGGRDVYDIWTGNEWTSSGEQLGETVAGDCNGDTLADPGIGDTCAAGPAWWNEPGWKRCLAASSDVACLGGSIGGSAAGTYRAPTATSFDLVGTHALIARGAHLEVVDVSDPDEPRRIGSINVRGAATDVAAIDTIALVAATAHLAVVDFSDPAHPTLTDRLRTCGVARAVAITPTGVGAVLCGSSLAVLAVGGPADVEITARIRLQRGRDGRFTATRWHGADDDDGCGRESGGPARFIEVEGSGVFAVLGSRLIDLDVSDPSNPTVAGEVELPFEPDAFGVRGGLGYLVGRWGQTAVVDLRGSEPVLTGRTHDVAAWAEGVRWSDGVACRLTGRFLEVARVQDGDDDGGASSADGLPGGETCCGRCRP